MFIGSPDITSDDIDRLKGIRSTVGNIIHITDGKNDNILSVITAKNIPHNEHYKSLIDNRETFDFEAIGEQNYDDYIKKGNRVIVPGEYDGELIEFTIDDVNDRRSTHKLFEVKTYGSYLDLRKSEPLEPGYTFTGTAREHMIKALANTEYKVGVVESDRTIKISFENHTTPFEYLKRIAREFDLELNFRIEHNGLRVVNRPVDALNRVGAWRGREITFGKDLQEINRIESGDVYTALIGLGPERDDGTRLQVFVEDYEALRRWGRPEHNPQHLIGVYEPQSERDDMTLTQLRQYTKTELDKRKNSVINYEIKFLDLEHIVGHENKVTRFGDTLRIKDTLYTPNLYLEARIFEMRRNVIVPADKEYVLGDFIEYDADTIHSIYDILKRQLAKKAGIQQLLDYAEPKKVESNTPPTIKDGENPIWVDTSKTPKVAHVVIGGQWQKMTPTTPQEVDAYTKQQVDSKDQSIYQNSAAYTDQRAQAEAEAKAAQALADAKAFSRNARNITEGVIDVGAIPLRTSATGARLEWDGVNGLVQYNALGEPVSWLDLDANAHFANAFLSGRVEANSGHFGKNKRVTIGDDGLTIERPDGALWMQDGLVHQDYAITGADPHQMDELVIDGYKIRGAFSNNDSYYYGNASAIDGTETAADHEDIRDPNLGNTVNFQRYYFIHSSRYFVMRFQPSNRTRLESLGVRFYDGNDLIARWTFSNSEFGTFHPLVVDLGTPTYERMSLRFRIGFLRQWKLEPSAPIYFRISQVYLTDYL